MSVETTPDTPGEAGNDDDEVRALRQERDDLQDRLLRAMAEFDNFRKRTERERRELSEAIAVDLVRDLVPVLDDLDRAIAAADNTSDPGLKSGVELIRRQLADALRRRGVEPFESVGQDFDPAWHEALTSEPANGHRDGEIVDEIRRGYRLGPRLVRPALVRVAKA